MVVVSAACCAWHTPAIAVAAAVRETAVRRALLGLFIHELIWSGHDDCQDSELDPNHADDTRAYRIKLSKWYQGTVQSIQNPIFWYLLSISRCFRSPLRHFLAFVQLHAQRNNSGEVMKQLVTWKLDELNEEFRVLFESVDQISARAMDLAGCDQLLDKDPAARDKLELIARKLLFQQWSAFQRRILHPLRQSFDVQIADEFMLTCCGYNVFSSIASCQIVASLARYPFKLLWLLKEAPLRYCPKRRGLSYSL